MGSCTPWPTEAQSGAAGHRGMGCRAFLICIAKSDQDESLSSLGYARKMHRASCGPCW